MVLPPLATVPQLTARLGHTVDEERAQALLEDASAIVRGYTRQTISRVENDTVSLRVDNGCVVLPQRPADKPTLVVRADGTGVVPAAAWWWTGMGIVELNPPSWLANGPSRHSHIRGVTITYSHGYAEIPGDVVAVVCEMVGRVIDSGIASPGLDTEAVDDYRAHMGAGLVSHAVAMTVDNRRSMDRYRIRTGTVKLR